jgi:hypothetical protein
MRSCLWGENLWETARKTFFHAITACKSEAWEERQKVHLFGHQLKQRQTHKLHSLLNEDGV